MQDNISDFLLNILACPNCKQGLSSKGNNLLCHTCALSFPVKGNIPIMLLNIGSEGAIEDTYLSRVQTNSETLEFYNEFYRGQTDYVRFGKADIAFVEQMFQFLSIDRAKATVLDVGAGTGYFVSILQQLVGPERVVGVDFSLEGFSTAQKVYGSRQLAIMDAYDLGFKDETFDVIFAIGLTPFKKSNMVDVAELTRRLVRPLKKGGHFIFVFSSNLSGKITSEALDTNQGRRGSATYYNHNAKFISESFAESGQFQKIEAYSFIRPLATIQKGFLFSNINTKITEMLMLFTLRKLSARLVVVGRK